MANAITLATLQAHIADAVNVDSTVTANVTRINRYINLIQQDICGRWDWPWIVGRFTVQTVVDKTAGTVSINNGSQTVTGVGTAFAATDVANSYIQFQGDPDWYNIATYSSATSITVDTPFGQPNLSGGTYIIRRIFYDIPATVDRIISAKGMTLPTKLVHLGITTMDLYDPGFINTGTPLAYAQVQLDPTIAATATTQWQVSFEPIPDAVYNIEFRSEMIPVDLTVGTHIPVIPYKYFTVLANGAIYLYLQHQNDPSMMTYRNLYEAGIEMMKEDGNGDDDTFYVLQPNEVPSTNGFIPMPSNYEPPTT